MKKEKLSRLLSGIILILLGVLVAIFREGALDVYFGIVCCAAGLLLLIYTAYLVSKKEHLTPTGFIVGSVLLTMGISLFVHWITVGFLVSFIVVAVLGAGAGLVFYGAYLLSRKEQFNGFLNVIIGVVAIVLAILYKTVPDFAKIFWVIVGVVIAVYGVLEVASAFIEKK